MLHYIRGVVLSLFLLGFAGTLVTPTEAFPQKEGKGDLEDFADDYGEEEEGSDDDDDAAGFFVWLFLDNMAEFTRLWGRTPGTEFGPFPSFPYAEGEGFATNSDDYRSFYFNTEFNYHHLNEDLRSYILKWETQFAHRSKLSMDLAVYEEDRIDEFGRFKDHLTFFGFRYGYALYRTPQMIVNLEGGFRGFHRNTNHGGPEIALDMTLFPQRPLIIETELAAAYVSNGLLYTAEASAGFALGRIELLGGFRVLKNKDSDMLDGFRLGVRVWY